MARDACVLHERSTLALSVVNERQFVPSRSGAPARPIWGAVPRHEVGRAGRRLALRRGGTHAGYAASVVYVLAGLLFRYVWVGDGKLLARDDADVAEMACFRRDGH
jgi:hypothetical protein